MSRIEVIGGAKLYFRGGYVEQARELVEAHHYSKRMAANVQFVGTWHEAGGLFGDDGDAVAACVFSIPPTRWSEPVLELARLVRRPDVVAPLSALISKSVKFCHQKTVADLFVSFADWTHGHHGGIYQAASWNYGGMRAPRLDGVVVSGEFIPGRSANSRYGTQSPGKLSGRGLDVSGHWDLGKHIYFKSYGKSGAAKAARLGLHAMAYPKPARAPVAVQGVLG